MEATEVSGERPGRLRRAAAGAWHVPAGIVFLVRHPGLWPLAALPAALAALLLLAGLVAGVFALPLADDWLAQQREGRGLLGLLFAVAVYAALPVMGLLLGLALALLLAAPILDRLSLATERRVRGGSEDLGQDLAWEVVQSLHGALYFAVRTPGFFLVGLVPFLGPVLAGLWAAHALAFQATDGPLQRHGLDFWRRRLWHERNRLESLGFGLASLATMLVPFANLLLAPALTVGATRLVLELQDPPQESAVALPDPSHAGAATGRAQDGGTAS